MQEQRSRFHAQPLRSAGPPLRSAGKPSQKTAGKQAGEGTGKVEQPERGGAGLIVLNSHGESVRLTATSPPGGRIGGGNGGIRFPGY